MSLTFAVSFICRAPLIILLENVIVFYNRIRVKGCNNLNMFRLLGASVAVCMSQGRKTLSFHSEGRI